MISLHINKEKKCIMLCHLVLYHHFILYLIILYHLILSYIKRKNWFKDSHFLPPRDAVDQFPPPENKKLSTQKSEELSCVKKLKVFCGKNAYVRSILYMELGRVEEGDDLREGLLQVSEGCVCVIGCMCVYSICILMLLTLL